jgi:hypothetical protein
MPRTLDDALSISPINAALVEGNGEYPNTMIRLLKDGSAKGLQVQNIKGFMHTKLTPSEFEEFRAGVSAKKFNCRPLEH